MSEGQAALEFLVTYGWAVMVLLIMVGALSYFGLTNPTNIFPERCTFPQEIICDDYMLDSATQEAKVDLKNNFGSTVILQNVTCEFPDGSTASQGFYQDWGPKEIVAVECAAGAGSPLPSNTKEKVLFTVIYRLASGGYDHRAEGEVFAST